MCWIDRGDLISHILLRSLVLGIATVMLAVHAPLAAGAGTARPHGPLVPDEGVLLGAYADPDGRWTGSDDAMGEVEQLEQQLGRTLAIDHRFYSWTDGFPGDLERWDVANGRIPLITWEPWGTTLDAIATGSHDGLIRERARAVAALGSPLFLRFAHEMNGDWYPWSGSASGGSGAGPARYVAAWRRVHALFEAEGASNVVWVWAPNHVDAPADPWNHWTAYYPGDAYVDWVGIDAYNWGTSQTWSRWTDLGDLVGGVYGDYADRKPIMIAETSSTELGGDKAAWLRAVREDLPSRFPAVAALVWFHVDKEQDWRVDSSGPALEAFRAMAGDPAFGGPLGTDTPDDADTSVKVLGGRSAVSDGVLSEVGRVSGVSPVRLAGSDRYGTAAAVVADAFPSGVSTVYVATGESFADALAGGAAAAVSGAPVLLTGRDHLPAASAEQLRRLGPASVKVLGGRSAVSDGVLSEVGRVSGVSPVRLAGSDRYGTAAAVVADAFPSGVSTVYVATGESFADALAGGAAAAVSGAPVLLTGRDHLPAVTAEQLGG